jgi:hypothetical protein
MPRKSEEARELAKIVQNPIDVPRPDAPYDLSDDEVQEWVAIVNAKEAGWFPRETWPLLTNFCRLTCENRHLAAMLVNQKQQEKFSLDAYRKIVRMMQDNSRVLAMLATKMRLDQQSSYDQGSRKTIMVSPPWEKSGGKGFAKG